LTLAELQTLADGIPAAVLRTAGLESIPATLQKMTNMPKRQKAIDLLAALHKLAVAATERQREAAPASPAGKAPAASRGSRKRVRFADVEDEAKKKARLPSGSAASGAMLTADDEEEDEEEEEEEEEDEDAVYEEWDKVHLKGALETLDVVLSTSADAKLPLKIMELQALVQGIPRAVLRLAGFEGLPETLAKMKNMPKREKAILLLEALQRLATTAATHQTAATVTPTAELVVEGDGKLSIRRLTTVGSISDKDPIDFVDVSKDDTIAGAVERVFATLGQEGALKDFLFRRVVLVTEEGKEMRAKMIPVEGTFNAIEAKEIVLCRKGG
jgi:hypothetical protein